MFFHAYEMDAIHLIVMIYFKRFLVSKTRNVIYLYISNRPGKTPKHQYPFNILFG